MVGTDHGLLDERRRLNVGHELALLAFDVVIKKPKHIVLPPRHRKVKEVVPIV
jgi:hypothetical protein